MQIATRSYCYLLFWFGLIALCSNLTPYFANDFRYLKIQGTEEFVSSISDIFISQYHHYFEWGGRTVAHIIAQYLLYVGKPVSAVIQACCYLVLILFIYYNAYGIKPTLRLSFKPIIIITLLLFLQLRMYGEVVFNIVSSANYLYTTTIILIFLLPYRISMRRTVELTPYILCPLMAILGLLSGWSNENTAAALATFLGLYLLFNFKKGKLTTWQVVGYVFFLIGFALLIFAPGNQARLDSMEDKGFDYIEHTFGAIHIFAESLLTNGLIILAMMYVLFKIHIKYLQYLSISTYYSSMWFFLAGFFSLFLMIFSPNFPARATTPFTVFSIVALVGFAHLAFAKNHYVINKKITKGLLILGCALMGMIIVNMVLALVSLHNSIQVRNGEITRQEQQKVTNFQVNPLTVTTYKYIYVADVRKNEKYWTNQIVSKFYEIDSIKRVCDPEPHYLGNDFRFFTLIGPVCEVKKQ